MTRYKIKVSIDENNSFWIVVDDGRFIRNPTQEDLKGAKITSYSKDNICPICREENSITDKSILYPRNANRDTDKKGDKVDKWVCKRHSLRNYHRYDSDSNTNLKKSMSAHRTGNLRYGRFIFGDICEDITHKWLGAKKLSVEKDNYRLPLDHARIPKGVSVMIGDKLVDLSEKVPQTKGINYIHTYKRWDARIVNDHHKRFDVLILYCANNDGKIIERTYIFPYSEIIKRTNITIYMYDSKRNWYESFRVTDKEDTKKVNDILQLLINKNNNINI